MGLNHADDRWSSRGDLGFCSPGTTGRIRRSSGQSGQVLNERGSAVISALSGITLLTTITLTSLSLGLAAVNVLVIRDAAIDASQQAALAKSSSKSEYLLKLIRKRVPSMVAVQVTEIASVQSTGYRVEGSIPGLGLLSELTRVDIRVSAANETIL